MEYDVLVAGVVFRIMTVGGFRILREISSSFGASDRLQKLSSGRRRLCDNVEFLVSPVRRHLASARCRIVSGPDSLQQLFFRSHTESKHEPAVTIIGIEPVISRLEDHRRSNQQSLMSGA